MHSSYGEFAVLKEFQQGVALYRRSSNFRRIKRERKRQANQNLRRNWKAALLHEEEYPRKMIDYAEGWWYD